MKKFEPMDWVLIMVFAALAIINIGYMVVEIVKACKQ